MGKSRSTYKHISATPKALIFRIYFEADFS